MTGLRACDVPDCDRFGRELLCPGHRARLTRHGDVQAHIPLRRWYIDPSIWIGYTSAHKRVEVRRGRAAEQACITCSAPAREWAYRGGAAFEFTGLIPRHPTPMIWSGDPHDYDPMCAPCHRATDRDRRAAATVLAA